MSQNNTITYRPGTEADSYAVFNIFEQSIADLTRRTGSDIPTSAADPKALARTWQERQSLYDHLSRTADQFWVAERSGQLIGFSRSITHGNTHELTEFFVLPNQQSSGVGRELISRAFPKNGHAHRAIIATTDPRAQALYLKSGVYPRFPIYYFGRKPEIVSVPSDITYKPIEASSDVLETLGNLDVALLGHRRDSDHTWLLSDRSGYLYYRNGQPVGYGYLGYRNGPFALLDPIEFPAILAHAENCAAQNRREKIGLEVPAINEAAINYLLSRKFKMDDFITFMMTNKPFGKFENYILTNPPFFM